MGLCPRRNRCGRADYETLAQVKLLVPSAFRGYVPARHPALRYGLALNDRGYFWEAQEILEAVWAAAPQGGRERILLRACIRIANANLRLRIQKPDRGGAAARRGLGRAERAGLRKATAAGTDLPMASRPRAGGPAQGQTGAAAFQDRLGGLRRDRPNMKQNAHFVISGLDLIVNMHYCAYNR